MTRRKETSNTMKISLIVNGTMQTQIVPNKLLLVEFLREYVDATSVKLACDTASCGACTALVRLKGESDFHAVKTCAMFAVQCDGGEVITAEGLVRDGKLNSVQRAFLEERGLQCGYCTPGFIMATIGLLLRNPNPTEEDVQRELCGNLCRCGAYPGILNAVKRAATSFSKSELKTIM